MKRCRRCGRVLYEDPITGVDICKACGWGFTNGRAICPACVRNECENCISFRSEEPCSHECFFQSRYGSPDDVGFITSADW